LARSAFFLAFLLAKKHLARQLSNLSTHKRTGIGTTQKPLVAASALF